MNFFKFLNFVLKSIEIPVGFYFQLLSITINFTDNRDYRPILNSLYATRHATARAREDEATKLVGTRNNAFGSAEFSRFGMGWSVRNRPTRQEMYEFGAKPNIRNGPGPEDQILQPIAGLI